jgi:hypothetical protein
MASISRIFIKTLAGSNAVALDVLDTHNFCGCILNLKAQ